MERPPDERSRHDAGERGGEPTQPGPPPRGEQETERLPAPTSAPYGQQPAPYGQGAYQQGPYQQPQYQGGQYQQPVYHAAIPKPKANGLAVASMVIGIIGMVMYLTFILAVIGAIACILALIFGMVSKGQIDQAAGTQGGRGFAITGIVLGWVGVGFLLLFLLFFGGLLGCGALVSS